MSLVNETFSTYVPPQHLPLAGKLGWKLGDGWGGESGGCIHKAMKKSHEINIISTLTSNKNGFKNAMKLGFFSLSSLTISLY